MSAPMSGKSPFFPKGPDASQPQQKKISSFFAPKGPAATTTTPIGAKAGDATTPGQKLATALGHNLLMRSKSRSPAPFHPDHAGAAAPDGSMLKAPLQQQAGLLGGQELVGKHAQVLRGEAWFSGSVREFDSKAGRHKGEGLGSEGAQG